MQPLEYLILMMVVWMWSTVVIGFVVGFIYTMYKHEKDK